MSEPSHPAEFQFVVTYSAEELRTYHKAMAGRYARLQNGGTGFGVLLGAILVLGLAVLAVVQLGLVEPSAVRPVLFTAYLAFMTGVIGYYLVMRAYFCRFMRAVQRGGTWNYSFTSAGICYRSATIEVRLAWRAVNTVEDLGKLIIMRFDRQILTVPSRVFGDNAARAAFISAARAWTLEAAAENA